MAKKKKQFTKLSCKECKNINYRVNKTKNVEGKLELQKFCKKCRKHTPHKEMKK